MSDTARPGTGRVLAGRYRLDRHLASGGMAEVWSATDEVLGRPVAVKILHAHLGDDPVLRTRFRHEAVAAARLIHPTIVAIYDTCHDDGMEAIVMELVRGRTLRDYLDERGRLDPVEVAHIGAEVAAALECAHRAGIVHRDVKPANILLSDDGRVLVTDFGIAKVLDEPDLTRTSQLLGTVKYLAPEQVEGGPADARTDVYALGAVLYEALCGEAPFRADNAAALALARLHRDPAPPHDVVAGVPPELELVVMRALARRPEQRFASAAAFRTALMSTRLDLGDDPAVLTGRQSAVVAGADPTTAVALDPTGQVMTAGWPTAAPAGPAPIAAPAGRRRSRPAAGVVVTIVVVVALLLVALLVASTDVGRELFQQEEPTGQAPIAPTAVVIDRARSFDPEVNDEENEDIVGLAVDGDLATAWHTDTYTTRQFGRLKTGVGLILDLASAQSLQRIVADSPSTGWSASVYVADGSPAALDGWGPPVAQAGDISGTLDLDLKGAQGSSVLIWITDLGTAKKVEIAEVALAG